MQAGHNSATQTHLGFKCPEVNVLLYEMRSLCVDSKL
jgi:hypothetical protein